MQETVRPTSDVTQRMTKIEDNKEPNFSGERERTLGTTLGKQENNSFTIKENVTGSYTEVNPIIIIILVVVVIIIIIIIVIVI